MTDLYRDDYRYADQIRVTAFPEYDSNAGDVDLDNVIGLSLEDYEDSYYTFSRTSTSQTDTDNETHILRALAHRDRPQLKDCVLDLEYLQELKRYGINTTNNEKDGKIRTAVTMCRNILSRFRSIVMVRICLSSPIVSSMDWLCLVGFIRDLPTRVTRLVITSLCCVEHIGGPLISIPTHVTDLWLGQRLDLYSHPLPTNLVRLGISHVDNHWAEGCAVVRGCHQLHTLTMLSCVDTYLCGDEFPGSLRYLWVEGDCYLENLSNLPLHSLVISARREKEIASMRCNRFYTWTTATIQNHQQDPFFFGDPFERDHRPDSAFTIIESIPSLPATLRSLAVSGCVATNLTDLPQSLMELDLANAIFVPNDELVPPSVVLNEGLTYLALPPRFPLPRVLPLSLSSLRVDEARYPWTLPNHIRYFSAKTCDTSVLSRAEQLEMISLDENPCRHYRGAPMLHTLTVHKGDLANTIPPVRLKALQVTRFVSSPFDSPTSMAVLSYFTNMDEDEGFYAFTKNQSQLKRIELMGGIRSIGYSDKVLPESVQFIWTDTQASVLGYAHGFKWDLEGFKRVHNNNDSDSFL